MSPTFRLWSHVTLLRWAILAEPKLWGLLRRGSLGLLPILSLSLVSVPLPPPSHASCKNMLFAAQIYLLSRQVCASAIIPKAPLAAACQLSPSS